MLVVVALKLLLDLESFVERVDFFEGEELDAEVLDIAVHLLDVDVADFDQLVEEDAEEADHAVLVQLVVLR